MKYKLGDCVYVDEPLLWPYARHEFGVIVEIHPIVAGYCSVHFCDGLDLWVEDSYFRELKRDQQHEVKLFLAGNAI